MVDFVGAGCGAADLITLRGKRLLEQADVIIYAGSLVNPQLLDYAKQGCRIYNSALMHLDEVIDVMEKAEAEGLHTVRLHTGDPSVYGAIREQMDRLDALGIAYNVTPGVSSFCGAAAALKAEYTLPDVSQTVILTRMAGRTPVPERESIECLAAHHATMVIFLSASMTEELSAKLIEGGYSADTPAAIVYKATWQDEKVVRCTVGTLAQAARENGISKTALITVGDFLGDDYELSKLYDKNFETEFRKAEAK
ncbi:precorrin-4 C(11)-methyltransferase [Ruminococcus flavefaciens]|uniref:precorrin-4 C(11)-methyltransferase n=1 Tax=Ruminococcus flavefaciens TaxID=1265 RepID=UPI00048D417D|nr:precorrin-4 C(11)-methyltransferase [Ruminococcus flavefaciens]